MTEIFEIYKHKDHDSVALRKLSKLPRIDVVEPNTGCYTTETETS
jgi:hypothetical protein